MFITKKKKILLSGFWDLADNWVKAKRHIHRSCESCGTWTKNTWKKYMNKVILVVVGVPRKSPETWKKDWRHWKSEEGSKPSSIGKNTRKIPRDRRRLIVTHTPVKDFPANSTGKIRKESTDNNKSWPETRTNHNYPEKKACSFRGYCHYGGTWSEKINKYLNLPKEPKKEKTKLLNVGMTVMPTVVGSLGMVFGCLEVGTGRIIGKQKATMVYINAGLKNSLPFTRDWLAKWIDA